MNDIADGLEAAAYAAKTVRVSSAPVFSGNRFSEKLKKISGADIFETESEIYAACGSTMAENRSIAVVSGVDANAVSEVSSMRIPLVIASTAMPDLMLIRDANAIIFLPESNQEILDNIIQAYKICEDNRVLLPALISIGNHEMREVVQIPSEHAVENMLPKLKLPSKIDARKPSSFNLPAGDRSGQRLQQFKAMENAPDAIKKTFDRWDEKFHRKYGFCESYMMEDAEYVLVVAGCNSGTVRSIVNTLRATEKVGMLRVRVLRPFAKEIHEILKGKKVAVIDSFGLLSEIRSDASLVTSGKYLSEKDVIDVFTKLKKSEYGRFWL